MPRYYCDYCDIYIQFDSYTVRKQHNASFNHKANVREFYCQYINAYGGGTKVGSGPALPTAPKPPSSIILPRPPPRPGMPPGGAPMPMGAYGGKGGGYPGQQQQQQQ